MVSRVVFIMLLGVFSNNVLSEWKYVGVDAASKITTYADPVRIQKAGSMVKMWHLFDMKEAGEIRSKSYLSFTVQSEYDCIKNKSRSLYRAGHKKNMGAGEIIGSESHVGNWKPIPQGTPKEYLFYIACRSK